ncbi:hypothetical protein I4I73_03245 [Pseudonocardia sp. KRD-184]|uniref:Tail assembly chaperone n=1 Tax=Pseudonocardia oceani TaxID=2792013 RepID=A0ABS6UJW2_9PSEU|nr:hypothetical protein [Pseudonocardia oceani]MBW0088230.1 hypothetical protein [Pseudonocardia oceani]MBW0095012.1 hypothetical protein [Pseudonocardia oceani]MBW0121135.1 hypothetical protein [Pseudonocardia oceani]MBW0131179.1 hypothetical protein [Pseudonocardia oceani]MBW0132559.1 hypothetical protein [Pseudonocardia oceani]
MKWKIPYAGEVYEFDDARLTATEARLQKRLTAGLSPNAAERARLDDLDGDAWIAALVIARTRIGMSTEDAAKLDLDEFDLMSILSATRAADASDAKPAKTRTRKTAAAPAPAEEPAPA